MAFHVMLRSVWQFQDTDPKNQAVITPCFRVNGAITPDYQQLCDDLAAQLQTFTVPASKMITVKAYDLEGAPPNYPKASKTLGTIPTPPMGSPQQCAVLSFYSGVNQPRRRGRLYIPAFAISSTAAELASAVIISALRTKVGSLATSFAALGGANVDWIMWSRVEHAAHQIDNWFVTESWGVQRRRRLKASTRTTGTTSG